ncbi:MAG: alkaline shock response membrane anchor protein AmaP [Candidatus Bipolaricaulota bacterium]
MVERYKQFLTGVVYFLFALFWFASSLGFFATQFDFLDRYDIQAFLSSPSGALVLYLLGGFSAAAALYFLQRLVQLIRERRHFVHQGKLGMVQISPHAVREMATEILRNNIGLSSFRIDLSHLGEGVSIKVRATVDPHADISALGEKIQTMLKERIASQTGLTVEKVDFYTQGVKRSEEESREEEAESTPADQDQESISAAVTERRDQDGT